MSLENNHNDSLYRPSVGMMILNKENKIFVGQRYEFKEPAWQMPQGGIDLHEETDKAMFRELQEEIGTSNVEVILKSKKWYFYDFPSHLAGRLWDGKYKGQKQIWYSLRFLGQDSEINLTTHQPEFRDWKWVAKDELLQIIVPFKKDIYQQVLEELWLPSQNDRS